MTSESASPQDIPFREFVALMAMLLSLTALSIDAVLPALPAMARDLHVVNDNHVQFVIGGLFLGFTLGQIVTGPLSDSFGRKPVIYGGIGVFVLGCLMCIFATTFPMLLAGRILQGFGASAPRIVSLAMTRDLYEGEHMARVMSFVMAVFIFVPAIAPAMGQAVMLVAGWRFIFIGFVAMAAVTVTWMGLRLPETLAVANRRPYSLRSILRGLSEVFCHRVTFAYTFCSGMIFSAMVGYLTTAQQIFQEYYQVGERFPVYFAVSALSIGLASAVNSKLVRRFGMRAICHYALLAMVLLAAGFILLSLGFSRHVPLWAFMVYVPCTFFCLGLLFGNLNAIAMEPMGHLAGIAAAVIGCLSSAISVVLGSYIGQSYNGTLYPLTFGFFILTLLAFAAQAWINRPHRGLTS